MPLLAEAHGHGNREWQETPNGLRDVVVAWDQWGWTRWVASGGNYTFEVSAGGKCSRTFTCVPGGRTLTWNVVGYYESGGDAESTIDLGPVSVTTMSPTVSPRKPGAPDKPVDPNDEDDPGDPVVVKEYEDTCDVELSLDTNTTELHYTVDGGPPVEVDLSDFTDFSKIIVNVPVGTLKFTASNDAGSADSDEIVASAASGGIKGNLGYPSGEPVESNTTRVRIVGSDNQVYYADVEDDGTFESSELANDDYEVFIECQAQGASGPPAAIFSYIELRQQRADDKVISIREDVRGSDVNLTSRFIH